jgi:hypothetical protein
MASASTSAPVAAKVAKDNDRDSDDDEDDIESQQYKVIHSFTRSLALVTNKHSQLQQSNSHIICT